MALVCAPSWLILINYPGKSRGISPGDILQDWGGVLIFNTLITKHNYIAEKLDTIFILQFFPDIRNYVYRNISVGYGEGECGSGKCGNRSSESTTQTLTLTLRCSKTTIRRLSHLNMSVSTKHIKLVNARKKWGAVKSRTLFFFCFSNTHSSLGPGKITMYHLSKTPLL